MKEKVSKFLRNPNNPFDRNPSFFHSLHGPDRFVQACGDLEFEFYADGFFPTVFEAYERLNVNLAEMIDGVGNEMLIEIDAANGVLSNLVRSHAVKKFFPMVIHKKSRTLESSTKKLCDSDRNCHVFSNLSKCFKNFKFIMQNCDENTKISVVFQNFSLPMLQRDKKQSKNLAFNYGIKKLKKHKIYIIEREFMIHLRKHPQVKSIFLVNNLNNVYFTEQICYQ